MRYIVTIRAHFVSAQVNTVPHIVCERSSNVGLPRTSGIVDLFHMADLPQKVFSQQPQSNSKPK